MKRKRGKAAGRSGFGRQRAIMMKYLVVDAGFAHGKPRNPSCAAVVRGEAIKAAKDAGAGAAVIERGGDEKEENERVVFIADYQTDLGLLD